MDWRRPGLFMKRQHLMPDSGPAKAGAPCHIMAIKPWKSRLPTSTSRSAIIPPTQQQRRRAVANATRAHQARGLTATPAAGSGLSRSRGSRPDTTPEGTLAR